MLQPHSAKGKPAPRLGSAAPARGRFGGRPKPCGTFGGALFVGRAAFGARRQHGVGDQAGVGADRLFDLAGDLRVVLEILLGVLAALADARAVVGEPGAGLLDHAGLDAEVDQLADLDRKSVV